eukprot:COSAG02_NODE_5498_length_4279_cov_11.389447_2_plen_747_part_00
MVLTDFGCAAEQVDFTDVPESQQNDMDSNTAIAAARYMAPEVLNGEPRFGKEADWWSVGVLVFEMLCGGPPYIDAQQLHGVRKLLPQDPESRLPLSVSPSACALIKALLQPRPELRLGAGERGSLAVRSHQFFVTMDWARLLAKQEEPPFVPNVHSSPASAWQDPKRRDKKTQLGTAEFETWLGHTVEISNSNSHAMTQTGMPTQPVQSSSKTQDEHTGQARSDASPEVPSVQPQRKRLKPKRRKSKATHPSTPATADTDGSFGLALRGTTISLDLRTVVFVLLPIIALALFVLVLTFNAYFISRDHRLDEFQNTMDKCSSTTHELDQDPSQQCLGESCSEVSPTSSPRESVPIGNECMGLPCPPGSVCEDSTSDSTLPKGKHICTCDTKWRDCNGVLVCGMEVECTLEAHGAITDAECYSQPCLNGGTCYDSTNNANVKIGEYLCSCPKERHGLNCEFLVLGMGEQHYVGLSDLHPLKHVLDMESSVVLEEEELDNILSLISLPLQTPQACASIPCQNNATCRQKATSYECVCIDGWDGDNCETQTALECPYMSTAQLDSGPIDRHKRLDSPCNYNACIVHSDGCECLLYQWHYCSQPQLKDPFCVSLLAGMAEQDAKGWLETCMHEMKVLRSRSQQSNSTHEARSPAVLDLTHPPAFHESAAEVEIAFLKDGPLGLKLKPDPQGAATVHEVTAETQVAQPGLSVGMVLRQIGDTPVSGQPYKSVLRKLKKAGRPLVLRFGTNSD